MRFAGERSTEWRLDVRGAIAGLASSTTPVQILHTALESVALRFRNVYEIMEKAFGGPREVIGSGGALLHSQVWTQMMADTPGHAVTLCPEPEATDPARKEIYLAALAKQRRLYRQLFEENK